MTGDREDRPRYLHEVDEPPVRCSCDPDDPDHECPPNPATGPVSTVCLWFECDECDGAANPYEVEDGIEGLVLCSCDCHEIEPRVVGEEP